MDHDQAAYSTVIAHLLWSQQAAQRAVDHLVAVADPDGGDSIEPIVGAALRLVAELAYEIKALGVGKAAYPVVKAASQIEVGDCVDLGGGQVEVVAVELMVEGGRSKMRLRFSGQHEPFHIPVAMQVLVVSNLVVETLRTRGHRTLAHPAVA